MRRDHRPSQRQRPSLSQRPGLSLTAVLAIGLCLAPGLPARAQGTDFCTEAWVIRNLIFDRLGHCFGSVAGRGLFDNADCVTTGPTPPPGQAETVAAIREGEAFVGCRIDTAQPPSPAMRHTLARFAGIIDLPVPDPVGGYACWGYRGPAFRLHAGRSTATPVTGIADTGQSVITTYLPGPGGWIYGEIATGPGGVSLTEGWFAGVDLRPANCDRVAG
jgi:hypothetical protein